MAKAFRASTLMVMWSVTLLAGCDASNEPVATAPAPTASAASSGGSGTSLADTPQSSLGAAQRSAETTVKRAEEAQEKALKQLEDP